ncbi:hypothetical protein [Sphingobium subterraneum]|uniref:ElaB/YqjD/DUF883 family membrane-anchored ribosome-binding protein n=1 Tax=Sphingobium subterraneum TaxID=627688 RepID=A0A841IVU5_9SPHN|nr:hypothetical protein [Sphingobium subterraneum]MBB6122464.1 ElaB/YqjD/DUF883 family membrane-anchored ribosome-binding protein [Sphingobium subterraneum]
MPNNDKTLSAQPKLERVREIAGDTADQAIKTVRKGATAARKQTQRAAEGLDHARIEAGKAVNNANRLITEHPLAATAAAVAVGALFAYAFPRSARTLRNAAPRLLDAVATRAREAQDAAKSALPIAEVASLAEAAADAARKAPAAIIEAVKDGADIARETANDVLVGPAAEVRDQASELASRASKGAAGAVTRLRKAASRVTK